MKKLYVIGNGFDLYFGLPTKTSDFVKELEKIEFEGFNTARDKYYSYGVDWSTFEENLANIDLDEINEEVIEGPDYMSDLESAREAVIWEVEKFTSNLFNAREEALRKMIDNAEKQICEIGSTDYADFFDNDGEILSFNYTSTVESLFNYNKAVFHIHGFYDNADELVFGFKSDSAEFGKYKCKLNSSKNARMQLELKELKNNNSLSNEEKIQSIKELRYCYEQEWNDPYIDKEYEAIVDFYQRNKKDFQYEKLTAFLYKIGKIEEVVILGQSLGNVDREYFELIEKILSPNHWVISAYDTSDILEKEKVCKTYSFKDKSDVFKMSDILMNV